METAYFSELATDAIQTSGRLAVQFKYDCIVPEHLLLAIIDESIKNPAKSAILLKVFKHFDVNLFELIEDIENTFDSTQTSDLTEKIPLAHQTELILKLSYREAKANQSHIIGAEHILLSYLKNGSSSFKETLAFKYKLTYDDVKDFLKQLN